MITFSNTLLKNFIEENESFLLNSRIQKIQQPTRQEFIFTLRNNSESRKLYININPQYYHVCFMSKENEQKRQIVIPQQPPMFCMLLRKYLEGAKISKISQPEYERIFEIYIETYNELKEKIYLCLAIELMGKHSNVILYNYDTNIIYGCAHNVGAEKSKEREVMGGLPYIYPPKKTFDWYDATIEDVDTYYADETYKCKFLQLKDLYTQKVNRKIKKINTSLSKVTTQTTTIEKMNKYRLYGDLIMANLYNNSDFSKSINVLNYENNENITIELDNTKTLKENANKYYKLYNKAKYSITKSQEIITKLDEEHNYLNQLLYSITITDNMEDLKEIINEIEPNKANEKEKNKTSLTEIKDENFIIWIGKNNKQNNYIVSKLAKDDDLWFHTHNCAGSHILLRSTNISDELIIKCAKLAKEYSTASKSSKVGVIYTKAKYLKKPPKSPLGYVTYSNEEEIIID